MVLVLSYRECCPSAEALEIIINKKNCECLLPVNVLKKKRCYSLFSHKLKVHASLRLVIRHVHIRPALKSALKIALSLNFQFEQNRA